MIGHKQCKDCRTQFEFNTKAMGRPLLYCAACRKKRGIPPPGKRKKKAAAPE